MNTYPFALKRKLTAEYARLILSGIVLLALAAGALGASATSTRQPQKGIPPVNTYPFAFKSELAVEYGRLTFGAEAPTCIAKGGEAISGYHDVVADGDGWRMLCLDRDPDGTRRVSVTRTQDGIAFEKPKMLLELAPSSPPWLAGDVAIVGDRGLLMISQCGKPPEAGHNFFLFGGPLDGAWEPLHEEPLYRGQDAFGLAWDGERLINYQIAYQKYDKRFHDNMGSTIRRVLHIRTSPDGLAWTPDDSFGIHGPLLPDDMLITPDEMDSDDTEFYKFRAFQIDGLWSGILTKYISQPPFLPNGKNMPHGQHSGLEWWVSRDGISWEREMRGTSHLDAIPRAFTYHIGNPIVAGEELRWRAKDETWAINRQRRFYAYCRCNAIILLPVLPFKGDPLRLQLSFEGISGDRHPSHHQGYVLGEMVDPDGAVVPGFDREKCVHLASDRKEIELEWEGKRPSPETVPEGSRLRLLFRDTRLYSIRW